MKFSCCPATVSARLLSVLWVQGILAVRTGDTSAAKADGAAAAPPSPARTLMPAVGEEGVLPWPEVGAPGCREQPERLDAAMQGPGVGRGDELEEEEEEEVSIKKQVVCIIHYGE